MNEYESERGIGAKEQRLERNLRFLPYIALAGSAMLALWLRNEPPLGHGPVGLIAPALTAAWLIAWEVLRPKAWTERQAVKNVYVVGLLAWTALLVTLSPMYGFFAWWNYYAVDYLRGRWRVVGVIVAAALHTVAIFGGTWNVAGFDAAGLAVFVFVIGLISATVLMFDRLSELGVARSEHRRRMVVELAEANRKLHELIKENEGLHTQLLTQAREAGVLDERQRLAREIHDTIAQGLTGIVTQVQAARNAAERPEDWRQHLDNAARLARDSLSEARRSVQAMAPEVLETAHLPDAIADVARQWSQTSGVAVEVTTTGTARTMHPEVEVTLLRTTQEALANVAKHARASRVGLTLSYMEDVVTLDVLDDGVGFDPAAVPLNGNGRDGNGTPDGGFGLKAMRQRVDRLTGTLTIESEPGGGTVVSASLPAVSHTKEAESQEIVDA